MRSGWQARSCGCPRTRWRRWSRVRTTCTSWSAAASRRPTGEPVGEVVRVEGGSGASLLVVAGPDGEVLVPFAVSLCPTIDVERRLVVVDAPQGLLEVNQPAPRARRRAGRTKGTA